MSLYKEQLHKCKNILAAVALLLQSQEGETKSRDMFGASRCKI